MSKLDSSSFPLHRIVASVLCMFLFYGAWCPILLQESANRIGLEWSFSEFFLLLMYITWGICMSHVVTVLLWAVFFWWTRRRELIAVSIPLYGIVFVISACPVVSFAFGGFKAASFLRVSLEKEVFTHVRGYEWLIAGCLTGWTIAVYIFFGIIRSFGVQIQSFTSSHKVLVVSSFLIIVCAITQAIFLTLPVPILVEDCLPVQLDSLISISRPHDFLIENSSVPLRMMEYGPLRNQDFVRASTNKERSMIILVSDGLPLRPFVDKNGVDADNVASFKQQLNDRGCQLHTRHYSGASCTDASTFGMLSGLPSLKENLVSAERLVEGSIPIHLLKSAKVTTALFMTGLVEYSYTLERRSPYHCGTGAFQQEHFFTYDNETETGAHAFVRNQTSPYFLYVHLIDTHGTYRDPSFFKTSISLTSGRIVRLIDTIREFSGKGDPLILITSDHGTARRGVDADCPECHGHGTQVRHKFTTDNVLHTPMWVCESNRSSDSSTENDSAVFDAISKFPLTSHFDLMPTVLDWFGIIPRVPEHLFTGLSWLAPGASSRRSHVFAVECFTTPCAVSSIDGYGGIVHFFEKSCNVVKLGQACFFSNKTVTFPDYVLKPLKKAPSLSATEIEAEVLFPSQNLATLPFPNVPSAFVLGVSSRVFVAYNEEGKAWHLVALHPDELVDPTSFFVKVETGLFNVHRGVTFPKIQNGVSLCQGNLVSSELAGRNCDELAMLRPWMKETQKRGGT